MRDVFSDANSAAGATGCRARVYKPQSLSFEVPVPISPNGGRMRCHLTWGNANRDQSSDPEDQFHCRANQGSKRSRPIVALTGEGDLDTIIFGVVSAH
ncbi:hypothetical protein NGR_b10190 (plasmid) [Sinorhizobium fredii NGR234]|uniref:Uncharacterized protein n=1 Tax=Sinorhizobium fredii (strain NBRC 101917 / NGR234) TaxID=394 RepID=C3KQW4_SINFN|nr:hypothetical protein NGR_b10190 [Sinorhizobium fredii NGR234]